MSERFPQAYHAWNRATDEYFFQGRYANEPVYLDVEDEALHEISALAGVPSENVEQSLTDAVKATLALPPADNSVFLEQLTAAREWGNRRLGPPPFLALLAFLSLVAEQMRTDAHFSGNNYYGRLCSILGLDGSDGPVKTRIVRSYAEHVAPLWRLYNDWIRAGGGVRGKPTAFAFDHRVHVGIPLSQALVRQQDRRKLVDLFLSYRLQPGQAVSRGDMKRLLADWLPHASVSAGLRVMSYQQEVMDRLSDIACVELQSWDGTLPDRQAGPQCSIAPIVLVAHLRRLPRLALQLEVMVRSGTPMPGGQYVLEANAPPHAGAAVEDLGRQLQLLPPHAPGWQGFEDQDSISIPDLLHAQLNLAHGSSELRREPRRVVVLEYDEELWSFVEVPRAHLGRDLLVIVAEDLASQVSEALLANARPGYRSYTPDALPGLPTGWVAFTGVELMRLPTTNVQDLSSLVPIAWIEIALGGGFRLPGRATWLRTHLPEVRLTTPPETGELELLLVAEDRPLDAPISLGTFSGTEVISLDEQVLDNGNYRIAAVELAGQQSTMASAPFRIGSSSAPRVLVGDQLSPFCHRPETDDGWAMLSCSLEPPDTSEFLISGGWLSSDPMASCSSVNLPPPELGERFRRNDLDGDDHDLIVEPAMEAKAGAPPGCLLTGAHYFVLEPGSRYRLPWNAKIEGACKFCGLEHWFPARPRHRRSFGPRGRGRPGGRRPVSSPVQAPLPTDLKPVDHDSRFGYSELMEALTYWRRGDWGSFEGLTAHVSDEPWFALEAAQLLFALGHVELALDRQTLRPAAWAMTPPTLVTTARESEAVLCGWRSEALLDQLAYEGEKFGAEIRTERSDNQPDVHVLRGVNSEKCQQLAASCLLEDGAGTVQFTESTAAGLSRALSSFSSVSLTLPSFVPPSGCLLQRWDPTSNRWFAADNAAEPGAYRTQSLPRRYGYRPEDGRAGQLLRADAKLVKWLAARDAGISLLAYNSATQDLAVPLGAGLPGLYERAAVLCSGRPPASGNGELIYRNVTEDVASAIWRAAKG